LVGSLACLDDASVLTVSIKITTAIEIPAPDVTTDSPYCGSLTLGAAISSTGYGVIWYNDEFAGDVIPLTTVLTPGDYTFWGEQQGNGDCKSTERARVDITVKNCEVELNVRVFLQAVMDPLAMDTIMTSRLQKHPLASIYPNVKLPIDNPYKNYTGYEDVEGYYHQIGNPDGPAGVVVDWILVEIWGNVGVDFMAPGAFRYDLLERRALLLKPKGYIVDTMGNVPKFMTYEDGDVRIVVRHRNHLAVISNIAIPFISEKMTYDFTTGIDQAYNYMNVYGPAVLNYNDYPAINNSVTCLWAGDVNFDGTANAADLTIFNAALALEPWDYHRADVTLDAILNNRDLSFIRDNTIRNIYSPVIFFIKN
jgi:hypothetical protein